MQKLLTFFSTNFSFYAIHVFNDQSFNDTLTNIIDTLTNIIVNFEQLSPENVPFAWSDQKLHWMHFGQQRMQRLFMQTMKTLIRLFVGVG